MPVDVATREMDGRQPPVCLRRSRNRVRRKHGSKDHSAGRLLWLLVRVIHGLVGPRLQVFL